MRRCILLNALAASMLGGCGGQSTATDSTVNDILTVAEVPTPATPNFDDHEGDKYYYVTAVSEEDQKKGKSAGDVVTVRFLGKKGDRYRLEVLGNNGQRISVAECANPCKVIKTTSSYGGVERLGFNENSVIGSAFLDAFNGLMVEVARMKEPDRVSEPDITTPTAAKVQAENPADDEYQRLDELCRGGAGDAAATQQACEERDRLYAS